MHWIIGTAGHIDHGKTSLVEALTGVDTDRLKEEKERGISIDLGFASLPLPDGTRAGVVDVPGHERFIKNMLAGAHGIDLVLFTVAADDGVMPQTVEHLDIVHLLGVRRAVFVITKADLVTALRLSEVADEIRGLIAGTALEHESILPFALPTLQGLDAIRTEIVRALRNADKPRPPGLFRLPVDRAFLFAGHGLIVTGTAIAGDVHPGDRVRCLPAGDALRVRSVEVHGQPVPVASWGHRIALNLVGDSTRAITRGDVIVHEAITLTCVRFDAEIEIRPSAGKAVKDHQRVRVHVGTAERIGKIVPMGSTGGSTDRIAPSTRAWCQIVVSEPVAVMRGDHFIIRDETAQHTLGGGRVLLPAAPRRRRTSPSVLSRLAALASHDMDALIEAVVTDRVATGTTAEANGSAGAADGFAVSGGTLAQLLNEREEIVRERADAWPALHPITLDTGRRYALEIHWATVKARVIEAVRAWHLAQPLSPGLDIEDARARTGGVTASGAAPVPSRLFRLLVDELEHQGTLVREGSALRLPSHRVQVTGADQVLADRVQAALSSAPLGPPDVKSLGETLGLDRVKLLPILRVLEKEKRIIAVAPDLYFAADAIQRVRDDLKRDLAGGKTLTTAAFRDRYQTSRKYAIPILEYFDRQGVTIRIGEARRLR
ncbi:MAG: selenocysteine-specific translation elongation factor [Acidimicrobiia bacterium]|nr:selenocysteine-specific translation elongation factor [Acidimicrobiia bacterium]